MFFRPSRTAPSAAKYTGPVRSVCLCAALLTASLTVGCANAADVEDVAPKLKPAAGYKVSAFADGLSDARLMTLTSEGDVIVSLRGPGRVVLLPLNKSDESALAGAPITLVHGLRRPHGLMIDGGFLYIAAETQVLRYNFDAVKRAVTGKAEIVLDGMPSGGHSTRTIRKGPDGAYYVSVGSSCNVCIEDHKWRAALLRFTPGETPTVFATGLRNTVGYDWHPKTQALYSVDNGRDWLGDDEPPGEVNLITKNGFYGWPFFNGDNALDPDFGAKYNEARHGKALAPVHKFTAHVAALSLRFLTPKPDNETISALVGQHGSWNRSKKSGYKVVRLDFSSDGSLTQSDFLTGFLQGQTVIGRPVDTLELTDGRILVTDDRNGIVWQMTPEGS